MESKKAGSTGSRAMGSEWETLRHDHQSAEDARRYEELDQLSYDELKGYRELVMSHYSLADMALERMGRTGGGSDDAMKRQLNMYNLAEAELGRIDRVMSVNFNDRFENDSEVVALWDIENNEWNNAG